MQHNSIQMLVKGNPNECEPNTLKKGKNDRTKEEKTKTWC